MSMCYNLLTISDNNIHEVLHNPPLIWRILAPDSQDLYFNALNDINQMSIFKRWFHKNDSAVPTEAPTLVFLEGEGIDADLDKSWHGIHYLLTKSAWSGDWPLNFLLCEGKEVGDIDTGYGPARTFKSSEVKEIASALAVIDHDTLKENFDPGDMAHQDIYPDIWLNELDQALDYCLKYFDRLKQHVSNAAQSDMGLLAHLS
ncbi:YfbM family protein [Kaarinaea lacus]